MTKKLTLYSQPGCESCGILKTLLKEEGYTYKEINVFEHRAVWDSIREREEGVMYSPTLSIQIPKEKRIIYLSAGRDFDKEEEGIVQLKKLL
jgi:glutaredoxin